jgi:hypothetical protein
MTHSGPLNETPAQILAASACAAGRLVNSKNHRVERNGGDFQRRFQLQNRLSALTPSLPCHPPTLRTPVHAYAPDPGALLHVCARARSRLRARFTSGPVVASDPFSRPLSFISGTQNYPRV